MDPVVFRRCQHVITENERVIESVKTLIQNDLVNFGRLMNASHDSLKDDYEVSCMEIDLLVNLARQVPGVLGSRITGGGFGGCTVNLIKEDAIPEFSRQVLQKYQEKTGIAAKVFISTAVNGAEKIK